MSGTVRIEMTAIALTPVHVGDGTGWTPEAYDLRGDQLCRFEPARVLAGMGANARGRYLSALDRGDLAAAQDMLRNAAGDELIRERIAVSGESRGALAQALRDPGARSGAVKAFVRSGGRPYLPGSSLKGAFRTALASSLLPKGPESSRLMPPGDEEAMRLALGLVPGDTSSDPLRFLSVSDVALPEDATLVDKPEVMRGGHRGEASYDGIQMHAERLRSRADGRGPPEMHLTVTLNMAAMERAGRLGSGKKGYDRTSLFEAVNRFHWDIWTKEKQRFYDRLPDTVSRLHAWLGQMKHPAGGTLADRGPEGIPNYLLLRVGRFSHFESKSLAEVRQGFVPQAKGSKWRDRDQFGSTRTVIRMAERDRPSTPVPFGWMFAWAAPRRTAA